jgi:hypothetical protein
MYSAKVSNSLSINNKTGETKLNEFKVKVDGFTEPSLLEKAKESYNAGKDIEKPTYAEEWPEGTWYEMYLKMCKNLLNWKKKKYA